VNPLIRSLLSLFPAVLLAGAWGCGGGMFVSCPEGAEKAETVDGGYSCQKPDGTSHGPFRSLHPNGKVRETGSYVDGLEDGLFEAWFDDGEPYSRGEYNMGEPWGTFTVWHDNGIEALVRGYDQGVPVGIHRWIDDEGNPAQETEYQDGKKVRSSRWGRRGQKVHESVWEEELLISEVKWNNQGFKLYEAVGLHTDAGSVRKWSEQGKLLSLSHYSKGHQVDEAVYHGNGAVAEKRAFGAEGRLLTFDKQDENGAMMSRVGYDPAAGSTSWPDEAVGTLGIGLLVGDDARIAALVHGGPAALAGVRIGEKLLAIGDWQLPPAPEEEFISKRLNGAVGGSVRLVLQPVVGNVRTLQVIRVHRDFVDPRRTRVEQWSVAGSRVEQRSYKAGFMVEERLWYDSGNKRQSADYDSEGKLAFRRVWHENGQLREELAPVQGDKHLLWQEWDADGTRLGRGSYLWGTTDKAGSLQKDGLFSYWRPDGELKRTVTWKQGRKEGPCVGYHESGDRSEEGAYSNDLKDGRWLTHRPAVNSDPDIPSSALESEQFWAKGKRHGSFKRFDKQCGWWIEQGSYKDGVKHGAWLTRPGPRWHSCDESGMATRGTWSSRNRAETCTKGNYRDDKKYGAWKSRKDCWCEAGGESPCEVLVRKYGNDEILLGEEVSTTF